jgi:hypothetical protein
MAAQEIILLELWCVGEKETNILKIGIIIMKSVDKLRYKCPL